MAEKILTTENVRLYYGEKEALHGINLDYDKYGITALIGPSGSGKSTYLRALNRMHDLTDNVTVNGTFLFKGQDIYAPSTDTVELRKDIGMVFQQPNPFPFSIYDNVAFGLRISGEKNKAVLDEMVETSLKQAAIWNEVKDDLHKSALSLSGGQQQRVAIARALALNPKLIVADEPTSALDVSVRAQVLNLLADLKKELNLAMVFISHDIQTVRRVSDRIVVMYGGQILETGSTEDIFNHPTVDYTRKLLGVAPSLL